jgi:hypothetical protein
MHMVAGDLDVADMNNDTREFLLRKAQDVHHREACAIAVHVEAIAHYIREMNVSLKREGEIAAYVAMALVAALNDLDKP